MNKRMLATAAAALMCLSAGACNTNNERTSGADEDVVTNADTASTDGTGGTCEDTCPKLNNTRCDAAGAVETCADHDSDGCLEWGAATPCAGELTCVEGSCAISCEDTCDVAGSKQCNGNAVQTCKDHNADGCLEWGADVECVGGTVCKTGFCSVGCGDGSNECTV